MIGLKKRFAFDSDDIGFLTESLRSNSSGTGSSACFNALINDCLILCSISGEINLNDIVYTPLNIPFNGNDLYYVLSLSISIVGSDNVVCRIDNDGIITEIFGIC